MKLILSGIGVPILPLQGNAHNSFCSSVVAAPFLLIPAIGGDAGLHPLHAALGRSDEISSGQKSINLFHLKCPVYNSWGTQKNKGDFKRYKRVILLEPSV